MAGEQRRKSKLWRNDRGIALLIVLLVTALLIALIFEFAYATRISLNSAVSFRDSQRAYFLARSGIKAFVKYGTTLREFIPHGEWQPVPPVTEELAGVMIKWVDESGKVKITDVKTDPVTKYIIERLFESKDIDRQVFASMTDATSEVNKIPLISSLHQFMSDEDFQKVQEDLTVAPVASRKININAASLSVLESLGIDSGSAGLIVQEREKAKYTDITAVPGVGNILINGVALSNYLTVTPSGAYKIYAYATIGGYTKQVEAIVNGSSISYWRAL